MLSDGSLLLVLKNGAGATTGAQVIKPDGSKRLVAGTVKKGSFCVVNSGETPETVIIAEGLATALSVQQFRPDATIIAAIDAGNLLPVAQVMRQRYPDAQIIIAADNDIKPANQTRANQPQKKPLKLSLAGWLYLSLRKRPTGMIFTSNTGWKQPQQHLMIRCTSRRARRWW
jgi:putative DNA primase/helicase